MATTIMGIPGVSSAIRATEAEPRGPLRWQLATVAEKLPETPTATTLILDAPDWATHRAGQHLDVRLTAEDGYQAERSYSIASPPEDARVALTIERLEEGEVSPYLVDELRAGDKLELRGPIGGWFTWRAEDGGPLLLIAGGSGLVPLMAMLRHRCASRSTVASRLLVSSRSAQDLFYADELERLGREDAALEISTTFTRRPPPGWSGYARRVDREMLAEVAFDPNDEPRTFVCGPTAFVEEVADLLVSLGHDPSQVKTERFGPTG
jgi:ferredoxin-NADP reductase